MPPNTHRYGYVKVRRVVFRNTFTGDGSTTTFTLSDPDNATFDIGAWAAGSILNTLPIHITKTNKRPIYDSLIPISRNRITVSSINATTGVATLSHAPRNGIQFYVWYWFELDGSMKISDYYREDFVANMEAIDVDLVRLYDTDSSNVLNLIWNEGDTSDRTFNILVNGANRSITLSGDPTLADWFDQAVKAASNVNFGTIGCGEITLADGSSINLQEAITYTGATTENLIEIPDNLADALSIKEGSNKYITFITTDGEEDILLSKPLDIHHTATYADDHVLEIDVDAANLGDIKAVDIDYITGTLGAGQDDGVILVNIDETLATGGDVFGLEVLATDGSAGIYGMKVGPVIGPIHQDSGTFANSTTATDNTADTDVAVMMDGNINTTTAIFEANSEYIIIGAAAAFQDMELIFATPASVSIKPTFWYSIAGTGQFTEFTPVDGTDGCKHTGVISWDASDLTGHVADTGTGTFDIKIVRTKNNLQTTPILGYAKTAATTEYVWDKNGDVNIRNLALTGTVDGRDVSVDGTKLDGVESEALTWGTL